MDILNVMAFEVQRSSRKGVHHKRLMVEAPDN
jgi:hypothetical protein